MLTVIAVLLFLIFIFTCKISKTFVVLLLILIATAAIVIPNLKSSGSASASSSALPTPPIKHEPKSEKAPKTYCSDYRLANDSLPVKGCLYSLDAMKVFQKTDEGYLISPRPPLPFSDRLVFVYDDPVMLHVALEKLDAYRVDDYSYKALNGFDQEVSAFRVVPPPIPVPNFIYVGGKLIKNPRKDI